MASFKENVIKKKKKTSIKLSGLNYSIHILLKSPYWWQQSMRLYRYKKDKNKLIN